ncbi:PAS domain S-box protein [Tellurirhabdus bombi]|uniref:PAS domain S-box protein n=1 Tax=Tellurirhabdus bombi TaxID=2907205 RepID=UPI001F2FE8DB|nr:PAS domain S-box protein [Tellurirhabdus bombi]
MTGDHRVLADELKAANERFELLATVTRDAIREWNLEENTIWWNDRFAELFGYPSKETTSATDAWYDRIHPNDQDRVWKSCQAALEDQKASWTESYSMRRADGTYVQVHDQAVIQFQEAKAIRLVASLVILPTQANAEKSEIPLLRTLVDGSADLMSILELDGVNSYLNQAGMELLGFDTKEQVLKFPISQLHTPEDFEFVRTKVIPIVLEKGRWEGQMNVRHLKSGEVFPVYNNSIRIDDPVTGEPCAVGAVMRDLRPELAARKALTESTELFRNITTASSAALWITDENQAITYVNQRWIDWTGAPLVQHLGSGWLHFVLEEDRSNAAQLFLADFQARRYHESQFRIQHLNGPVRWVVCTGNPQYGPNGEFSGYIGAILDVTERVRAEQELRASEARFRDLIDNAPLPIAVYTGPELTIQVANEALLTAWGRDESVLGKTYRQALPELENLPYFQIAEEVFATGKAVQNDEGRADFVVDGQVHTAYFNYSYKALHNAEGDVYGVINTAVDITKQVVTRKQLEEVEVSLRGAIELAQLGTWELDPQTWTLSYSDRIRDWFGYSSNSVRLATLDQATNAIIEEDRERIVASLLRATAPGSDGIYEEEYTVKNQKNGQERILHAQAKAFFNENGEAYLLRGTAQDITARKKIEWELAWQIQERTEELQAINEELNATNEELSEANLRLQQSNENLQQFAYAASHDLQEPLRKIQSFGSLLQTHYAQNLSDGGLDLLQRSRAAAERMSLLVRDLLTYSRLTTQPGEYTSVNLSALVKDVLSDLELAIQEKEARITIDPLPRVLGNARQLTQLLHNLLSNGIKFHQPGDAPIIHVSSHVASVDEIYAIAELSTLRTYICLEVQDSGIGFDEKYLDRIFNMFQRLHGRERYPGTGVGLALCRKVVENHQGYITAKSQPGHGATFQVYLPGLSPESN